MEAYKSVVSKKAVSKPTMVRTLNGWSSDVEEIEMMIEDVLEDQGADRIGDLSFDALKRLYNKARDYTDPPNLPAAEPDEENCNMAKYNAVVNVNKRNRTVEVSIEVGDDKFLKDDLTTVERKLGDDVPVFMTMPQEIYEAIKRA